MNVIPFRPETFLSNDQIGGEMTEKEIYVFIEKMKKRCKITQLYYH